MAKLGGFDGGVASGSPGVADPELPSVEPFVGLLVVGMVPDGWLPAGAEQATRTNSETVAAHDLLTRTPEPYRWTYGGRHGHRLDRHHSGNIHQADISGRAECDAEQRASAEQKVDGDRDCEGQQSVKGRSWQGDDAATEGAHRQDAQNAGPASTGRDLGPGSIP